jgi:uncharacterized membrane protein
MTGTRKQWLRVAVNLTAAGAVSGGSWVTLIGLIFQNPLLGFSMGAAAGAASGALTDFGINDHFMKELAAAMTPRSSTCSSWQEKPRRTRCSKSSREQAAGS